MAKKEAIEVITNTHPGFILGMEIRARGFTQKSFAELIAIQQSGIRCRLSMTMNRRLLICVT